MKPEPIKVIVIEYRDPGGDVLAHIASTWEKAETWMQNNQTFGGVFPAGTEVTWFWWVSEEIVDDARIITSNECRTYDNKGDLMETSA